jgi:hypothetical protein
MGITGGLHDPAAISLIKKTGTFQAGGCVGLDTVAKREIPATVGNRIHIIQRASQYVYSLSSCSVWCEI